MPIENDVRADPNAGIPLDSMVAQTKYLTESDAPDDIKERYWGVYSKETVLTNYNDRRYRSTLRGILLTKLADRWGRKRGELRGDEGAKYIRDNAQVSTNAMSRIERARDGKFQEMITPDFSMRGGYPLQDEQRSSGLGGGIRRLLFGGH